MCPTNFKLLTKIKENKKICFLQFAIYVRGSHCDYSSHTSKNLATPLKGKGIFFEAGFAEEHRMEVLLDYA
jgi:hypothetical protein